MSPRPSRPARTIVGGSLFRRTRRSAGPPRGTAATPDARRAPAAGPRQRRPPADLGALLDPGAAVRLTPPPGARSWSTAGTRGPHPVPGPRADHAHGRFPGTLRIGRADDGTLSLTVALPFDRYLEGIAEVPSTWPRPPSRPRRSPPGATRSPRPAGAASRRGARRADLRDRLVPGLPGDPRPAGPDASAVGARRPPHRRARAPVRGTAGDDRVLLDLERPDLRQRGRLRELAAPYLRPGGRTRRRGIAHVALAGPAPVRRPDTVPARCGTLAARADDRRPTGRRRRDVPAAAAHRRSRRTTSDGREHLGAVPRTRLYPPPIEGGRSRSRSPRGGSGSPRRDPALLRDRTRLGARGGDGAVGRLREGPARAVRPGDPGLLLRGPAAAVLPRAGGQSGSRSPAA